MQPKSNNQEPIKRAALSLRILFVAAALFIVAACVIASPDSYRSEAIPSVSGIDKEIASSPAVREWRGPRNDILNSRLIPAAQAAATDSGLANNAGLDEFGGKVNLPTTDIRVFIVRLINIVLSLLGIILVCLFIYGGWLYMTSEGDANKIEKAKAIFKNAAIGLAIILSAFGIVNFILKALWGGIGGSDGTAPGQNYDVGVSALGDGIIESHYPARGQTDVPRNTMIIITFKEALNPNTVCKTTTAVSGVKRCSGGDLLTGNIAIFPTATGAELREDAADSGKIVSAKVESNDNKTFVFRPDQFLGSQNQEQWYGVRLFGDKLKKASGDKVTLGIDNYYQCKL